MVQVVCRQEAPLEKVLEAQPWPWGAAAPGNVHPRQQLPQLDGERQAVPLRQVMEPPAAQALTALRGGLVPRQRVAP